MNYHPNPPSLLVSAARGGGRRSLAGFAELFELFEFAYELGAMP
jgi:hypothetical protein